ncbi:hypothetical protein QFZ63_001590 [Streptomyces sp. B3I7]|uniref:hypothetical protein n=1 Tax=Streptomyces sp. B3I7 TaxID=3042269 RepID=UPI00278325B9|nr:hypothetical protein [Streptomyces sp. B3I7]MDQ0809876.1 hypothetical protein [Streptomyces sp. B3I7]
MPEYSTEQNLRLAQQMLDQQGQINDLTSERDTAQAALDRVRALADSWAKAGPPPLGVSMARWWDKRLADLHNAIQPADQTTEN